LKAFELADEKQSKELRSWINASGNNPEEKVNAVTEIYNELHIRNLAEAEMEQHFETALSHLDAISVPASRKEVLRDFAGRLMVREA
jgi:geranylgeranyl diphosphate synthase type II